MAAGNIANPTTTLYFCAFASSASNALGDPPNLEIRVTRIPVYLAVRVSLQYRRSPGTSAQDCWGPAGVLGEVITYLGAFGCRSVRFISPQPCGRRDATRNHASITVGEGPG